MPRLIEDDGRPKPGGSVGALVNSTGVTPTGQVNAISIEPVAAADVNAAIGELAAAVVSMQAALKKAGIAS